MGIFLVLLLSACNSTRKNISKEQTNSNPLENISKGLKNEISIWMNVPYKLGGNTKEGIDCSGFVYMIYNRVYEKKVPRTSIKLFDACKKIPTHKLQEGFVSGGRL
ncbi:MAG: C40 family peptidase [Bacteroidetes bacterium]|nr:C40 family peptidase [Bacteroidota bacterium]